MDLGLKDKVVAITGGTSGIGEAVALAFAEEGAYVAVCGRSEEKLSELKWKFEEPGRPLYAEAADVSDLAALERFVRNAAAWQGHLDVFINNAGLNIRKYFEEYTPEEFDEIMNTDLKAVFFGTRYAAEEMRKCGGGAIINTSSFTALIPSGNVAPYSAAKAGVSNLTANLAASLAPDHIRVNAVVPGMTVTPLTEKNIERNRETMLGSIPLQRFATPDDLKGAYLFLASEVMAGYVTGISLVVAGGKFASQDALYGWKYRASEAQKNG